MFPQNWCRLIKSEEKFPVDVISVCLETILPPQVCLSWEKLRKTAPGKLLSFQVLKNAFTFH